MLLPRIVDPMVKDMDAQRKQFDAPEAKFFWFEYMDTKKRSNNDIC